MKRKIIISFILAFMIMLQHFCPKLSEGVQAYNEQMEKGESIPVIPVSFEIHQEEQQESQGELKVMELTGYTANFESTGKTKNHPAYGITASGKKATKGITIAAGKNIPIGTEVYIPYFEEWDNDGIFEVQDRGGKIKDNNIDVFFGYDDQALKQALEFGRRKLDVYILWED